MALTVKTTPRGRALHTTASHPPAARLAAYATPLLAIPTASSSARTCASCLRTDLPVTACTGCRAASYCSKACQRVGWRGVHRAECPALRNVPAGRELPTPVRALLQVVVQADVWRAVGGLVGNEGGFKSQGRWEDLKLQGAMVQRLLGRDPEWVKGGHVVDKYAVVMCKVSLYAVSNRVKRVNGERM